MAIAVALGVSLIPAPVAGAQPALLLFHPGAFTSGDPSFEGSAKAYAETQGFSTVNVDYPLCDVPGAWQYAQLIAAIAGSDGSPVYAYGDSAGGMLAARLAEKGKVLDAAAYSPIPRWAQFVRSHSTHELDCIRGETNAQLDQVSPALYPSVAPIVDVSGVDDCLATDQDATNWAVADPYVFIWHVNGGHLGGNCLGIGGGPGNPTYDANMQRAINWLAVQAGLRQPGSHR